GVAAEVGLDNDNLHFECGWSWGIAEGAGPVEFVEEEIARRPGTADGRPYLYFTVVALDGINDLASQRTRELGLLDEQQRRLADALQIRWDLTQRYWSAIARFGNQRWPLEDIPWRTSDGEESDYYSLLVSSVLVQDLVNRQATDEDLNRAVAVLEELAHRGRITRRVMKIDPAVGLHVPGVSLTLKDTTGLRPQLFWSVADFAPLLLKRSLQAARLAANVSARDRLMLVAEATMDHLMLRQLASGPAAGLWDAPADVFFPSDTQSSATRSSEGKPSWYITSRVVEGLVTAAKTFEEPPLCSPNIITGALELLNEAEHLLNQEMLQADVDDKSVMQVGLGEIEVGLMRARRILNERPGTAHALILKALGELDALTFAHLDAARSN
ncbi:MAG: SCO2524 family protein, partial [Pseudonocardiaceae bacterium]